MSSPHALKPTPPPPGCHPPETEFFLPSLSCTGLYRISITGPSQPSPQKSHCPLHMPSALSVTQSREQAWHSFQLCTQEALRRRHLNTCSQKAVALEGARPTWTTEDGKFWLLEEPQAAPKLWHGQNSLLSAMHSLHQEFSTFAALETFLQQPAVTPCANSLKIHKIKITKDEVRLESRSLVDLGESSHPSPVLEPIPHPPRL